MIWTFCWNKTGNLISSRNSLYENKNQVQAEKNYCVGKMSFAKLILRTVPKGCCDVATTTADANSANSLQSCAILQFVLYGKTCKSREQTFQALGQIIRNRYKVKKQFSAGTRTEALLLAVKGGHHSIFRPHRPTDRQTGCGRPRPPWRRLDRACCWPPRGNCIPCSSSGPTWCRTDRRRRCPEGDEGEEEKKTLS